MKYIHFKLLSTTTFVALLLPNVSFSKDLGHASLYRRCHAHLIGETPKLDDPNLASIRSGSLTGLQACENLLSRMTINSADAEGKLINPNDEIAVKGLRNLIYVTKQFVKVTSPEGNIANYLEGFSATEDIFDHTAPALVMTENALNPNRNFRDIFSITKVPVAKRVTDPLYSGLYTMNSVYGSPGDFTVLTSARQRLGLPFRDSGGVLRNPASFQFNLFLENSAKTLSETIPITLPVITTGETVGIHYNQSTSMLSIPSATQTRLGITDQNNSTLFPLGFDLNSVFGKGILGIRVYLTANIQEGPLATSTFMPRRLSQSFIRDYMCRDLPIIREADALPFVTAASNANSFRQAVSCAACHATMDPMAGAFRSIQVMRMGTAGEGRSFVTVHNRSLGNMSAEAVWPEGYDANYWQRPANGKLFMRSYDGKLINKSVVGFSGLVDEIANTDDVYICAAKKWFQHFTGIDVKLFDAGDPKNSAYMSNFTSLDWDYRNFVINQGLALKQHQKVKTLISNIIKSPYYKKSDFGKER